MFFCVTSRNAQRYVGVKFSKKNKMSSFLFADDFVGITKIGLALQCLIGIVHNYSKCRQFETNVKKCAVVVFGKVGLW